MLLARAVTDLLGVTTRIHWGRHIFPRTNPVHPTILHDPLAHIIPPPECEITLLSSDNQYLSLGGRTKNILRRKIMTKTKQNTMQAAAIDRFGGIETITLRTFSLPEVGA